MIEWYFGSSLPLIARVVENVDSSLLDQSSWKCGVPAWPGIWWPSANLWLKAENDS